MYPRLILSGFAQKNMQCLSVVHNLLFSQSISFKSEWCNYTVVLTHLQTGRIKESDLMCQ